MGGRGASSGKSDKDKPYGSEFKSLLKVGNIKFVQPTNAKNAKDPLETMTKGRVYATVNNDGQINSISYYNNSGKRVKSINLLHSHENIDGPHTHIGYYHKEGGTRSLTTKEKKLVEIVETAWYNKKDK